MTVKIRIVFMVMLLIGAFYFTFFHDDGKIEKEAAENPAAAEQVDAAPEAHTVDVILERVYLDGEVSEEIKSETIWSMEDFWAGYAAWELVDMTEEQVVFRQDVDDISPLLKSNGYFGISDDGVLSIFNGRPGQSEIIQSFFQIDIHKLESGKRDELVKGIPVKSKQSYEQVIQSFQPYSLNEDASFE
ncbi:regulator [Rossellomorea vietnamensis]|uniref:Regulator n=1 Tax=Rossellomorea vietnamensis TaxID=218284 RepID=A0A5D4MHI0_9BACI|nr:intercompartmental signaling factor BofC [Rossellomorea vietnamensis]TYS00889.1 regulator [Rossellomorea vietnamensis]